MKPRIWNDKMWHTARRLKTNGASWTEIAAELGLTGAQVRQRFERDVYGSTMGHNVSRVEPSPQALLERDRRLSAESLRGLTGEFFGDPPPGFSALDRRGGA